MTCLKFPSQQAVELRCRPRHLGFRGHARSHRAQSLFKGSVPGCGSEEGMRGPGTPVRKQVLGFSREWRALSLSWNCCAVLLTSPWAGLQCWPCAAVADSAVGPQPRFLVRRRESEKVLQRVSSIAWWVPGLLSVSLDTDRLLPPWEHPQHANRSRAWCCFNLHCFPRGEMYFWRLKWTRQLGGWR